MRPALILLSLVGTNAQNSNTFNSPASLSSWASPSLTQFSPASTTFPSFSSSFSSSSFPASFSPASFPSASFPQSTSSFSSPAAFSTPASFSSSGGSVDVAYSTLYDQTKFRSFNMAISPSNLALMNQDPKSERKVACEVTVDYQTPQAQTYSGPNLACGYKGSVGALRVCFDAFGKFSPDDCRKPSYKIDADYFNKQADDRIAGVKRLMFHGAPADWSMMAERLAYDLMRQWGIVAPSATHAALYLNGQFNGVFVFVSAIDDIFSQKYFGNDYNQGKGALYKEAWFNPVHMNPAELRAANKYGKNEDAFMNEIESAMLATPMDEQSAKQFFDKYFDVKALVDVTAANTVLGNTDDWRQRHNMWWYIREDSNGKKAVLIPWDYDRLNDPGADTRGALKGKPWWDPNTKMYCTTPLRSTTQRGNLKSPSDPVQAAYWKDIFEATPLDVEVPVSCDRIAQLMALALGSRIRQRTRELGATVNRASMQASTQTWTSQIASAFARDPDGTNPTEMAAEQRSLLDRIVSASQKAVSEATNGDRGVSSPVGTSSSGSTFAPRAATSAVSSFASFVPKPTTTTQGFVPKASTTSSGFVPQSQPALTLPSFSQSQTSFASFQPFQSQTLFSSVQPAPSSSAVTFPSSQSSFFQPAAQSFSFSQTTSLPTSQSSFSGQFSTAASSGSRFPSAPAASTSAWGR